MKADQTRARPDTQPKSSGHPADDAGTAPLRANRDFRLLWIGQAASEVGSAMSVLALSLLVLAVTGSVTLTGVAGTLTFAVSWIMQLPAGYMADRYDRRKIMLTCDGIRAAAQLVLVGAILAGAVRMWLVVVLVIVSTAAWAFFVPAQIRAIRTIVRREQITEATAMNMARSYAADLTGPFLSGILFTLGRAIPFVIDTASFVISAATLTRIRSDLGAGQSPAPGEVLKDIRQGWLYVWRNAFLRSSMLYSTGTNFAATALIFLIVLTAGKRIGSGTPIGAALTIAAAGGVLGATIAPAVQRRFTIRRILVFTGSARAILVGLFALTRQPVALGVLLALFIMLSPTAGTALAALRTELVPPEILGRAGTCISFVATGLQPLAPLSIGILLANFGHWVAALTVGGVIVLITLYVLRTAGFEMPDRSS